LETLTNSTLVLIQGDFLIEPCQASLTMVVDNLK
jgi:hypothetical protein